MPDHPTDVAHLLAALAVRRPSITEPACRSTMKLLKHTLEAEATAREQLERLPRTSTERPRLTRAADGAGHVALALVRRLGMRPERIPELAALRARIRPPSPRVTSPSVHGAPPRRAQEPPAASLGPIPAASPDEAP